MTRIAVACLLASVALPAVADPLPSWNDTERKTAIIAFVERVTDPTSSDYVREAARIAVFDNDGTLWAEQPAYFQLLFAFDRFREMAAADPSLASTESLKAAAAGDIRGAIAGGKETIMEVIKLTHTGMSVEAYQESVVAWMAAAKHPTTNISYSDMTYQPMLELLSYLREKNFQTYIVSGGGISFMRTFSESAYNIPTQNVIGSFSGATYSVVDEVPTIIQDPSLDFIDDKEGKPIGIMRAIGQRPIFAVGNTDGDFDMLRWTTAGEGPRFGMLIHHTDAVREWAYDRTGEIGVLSKGLDEGPALGWQIMDMATDWSRIWSGGSAE